MKMWNKPNLPSSNGHNASKKSACDIGSLKSNQNSADTNDWQTTFDAITDMVSLQDKRKKCDPIW